MAARFLWEVSLKLIQAPPSTRYASTLADFKDASALQMFMSEMCGFYEEQVLGGVIGALYMTELFTTSPEEKSVCAAQAGVDEFQLDFLLDFGKHLFERSRFVGEDGNVTDEIEHMWSHFCSLRGVSVEKDGERKYPVLPPEDDDNFYSPPFRSQAKVKPASAELTEAMEKRMSLNETTASTSFVNADLDIFDTGLKVKVFHDKDKAKIPMFFELTHRIVHSRYFLCPPEENLGYNIRSLYNQRKNKRGLEEAEALYSKVAETEMVLPVNRFHEPADYSYSLMRSQLRRLLIELRSHGRKTLFRALLTARPPLSILPHFYAVVLCTVHARLWLSGIDLPLYIDSGSCVTYETLGSLSTKNEEEKVYESIYLRERVPSCIELVLHFHTHSHICSGYGRDKNVLIVHPEDYDVLGAPDDDVWRAVRKRIPLCIWYTEGDKVEPDRVFWGVVQRYHRLLDADPKWQRLHPNIGGAQLYQSYQPSSSTPVVFHR